MNKFEKLLLKQFVEERDKAILTFDLETFKTFYRKWYLRGFYDMPLPDDSIVEISIRKMVLGLANPPEWAVKEAKQWLIDHDCKPEF